MEWLRIVLGVLCVWRITHLLSAEEGPARILTRMRQAAGTGVLGQLVGCFYCLSLYVAAPLTLPLAVRWQDRLLLWPALSGGAILLERFTTREPLRLEDLYVQDPVPDQEERNVLS
jgi:hypothetical protein